MRIPIPLSCLILLLSTACAHKSGAYSKQSYDDQGAMAGATFADAAPALPMLDPASAAGALQSAAAAPMLASFAPRSPDPADSSDAETASHVDERAPDSFETMGADSIDQMLIFTAQLALEVEFSTSAERIDAAVQVAVTAGGYVAQMSDTTLHLRVPSKRFRSVMKQIERLGEPRSRQIQALDVSEEYNDLEVRLENLRATRERIEKLMSQSKDLSQILTIEKELERVTVEIDRIEGRLRLLASQAAFSTIAVAFSERPQQRDLAQAVEQGPPPTSPRTLRSSAAWIDQVGVHNLLTID